MILTDVLLLHIWTGLSTSVHMQRYESEVATDHPFL